MEFPNCPNFDLFFGGVGVGKNSPPLKAPKAGNPDPGRPVPGPPAAAAGAGRPCAAPERRAAGPGPRLLRDAAPGAGRAAAVPGGDPGPGLDPGFP